MDGQDWKAKDTSGYSLTPREYVVIYGTNWLKHPLVKHIGCIAEIEVKYDNAGKPTVYYAVMPFRPLRDDDEAKVFTKAIRIVKGGSVYTNSERPV